MRASVSFGLLRLENYNNVLHLSHDELLEAVSMALCGELVEQADIEEAIREGMKRRRERPEPQR